MSFSIVTNVVPNISAPVVEQLNKNELPLGCVTERNQIRPLHCVAQQYEWGRIGSTSTVARMRDAQAVQDDDTSFAIDETRPYAELWLGTHPNGMCHVTVNNTTAEQAAPEASGGGGGEKRSLLEYVNSDTKLHCGQGQDLSFLLKVLSVRKVLSIQAHPDKALAEKLHAERPTVYKDPNHKPEMAIALSDKVRAMCGFRPLAEIGQHMNEYPEFQAVMGEEMTAQVADLRQGNVEVPLEQVREILQRMFHGYMEATPDLIATQSQAMVARLQGLDGPLNDVQELILQLNEQFPGDCGIFAPLIFNLVELNKGEGLFIEANEPHAYVSGEIIECMACSDNVVRAGLTPKLKDVPTLVNMLTYKCCMPSIYKGDAIDKCTVRYQPPVEDFCMELIHVPAGETYQIESVDSPSVLLTMEGDAILCQDHGLTNDEISLDVSFGMAAFCSAKTGCRVMAGPEGVRLTRAFSNVFHS